MKNSKKMLLKYSSLVLWTGLLMLSANSYAEDKKTAPIGEAQEKLNIQTGGNTHSNIKSVAPPKRDFKFLGVKSLRGETGIAEADRSASVKQMQPDIEPIFRNYFQQPPMIPHRVREYKITLNYNKCMSCHGWDVYKKAKATKISQTHFSDRDGNAQSTLAARRYFCTQCHAPQVDAEPLVENNFTPVHDLEK